MLGGVLLYFLRDVVRILCIFSFLSFLDTLFLYMGLVTIHRHTLYLFSLIYCWCMFFFHLPFSCVVSFLSLYTCFLLFICNLLFCFTQRCLDEFCLKCFRNTGCQSLLAITLFLQSFSRVCVIYCIQQVNMSWVIYDFSHMFIC